MKNLITLYIGMNDKNTKKQEYSKEYFVKILDKYFSCYTLTECQGRYKHENGIIINESTLKVEFIDNYDLNLISIVEKIKFKLNQECVMITTQTLQVQFI